MNVLKMPVSLSFLTWELAGFPWIHRSDAYVASMIGRPATMRRHTNKSSCSLRHIDMMFDCRRVDHDVFSGPWRCGPGLKVHHFCMSVALHEL